jgi:hypothetical protein
MYYPYLVSIPVKMTNCFFTKLVTWKDPNLSAAFLTAGNVAVILLVLSGDAASWVLFGLVFGVLPLGLVARLSGFDRTVRDTLARSPTPVGSPSDQSSYFESHILSQLTSIGLIRLGVYFVVLARLFDVLGVAGTIWIVGNTAMLIPLALTRYGAIVVKEVRNRIQIEKTLIIVKSTARSVSATIGSFGPMAPAVSGGLVSFLAVIIASYLATSSTLLVANMTLIGYCLILLFSILPLSVVEKTLASLVPSSETIQTVSERVKLSLVSNRALDLVLWDNYKNSVVAFSCLYVFYFISKYVGVVVPVALGTGLFAAFTLTPTILKEKAYAEIDKTMNKVRESVVAPIQSVIRTPPRESKSPDLSPRSAPSSPRKSQSPKKSSNTPRSPMLSPKAAVPASADPEHNGE